MPLEREKTQHDKLNAICPYFTMFPLSFPLKILQAHASKRDLVLDPFCGRGTTNFAARMLGLRSFGIDANSLAVAVTNAKMADVTPSQVVRAAKRILEERKPARHVPEGEFWRWAFESKTLAQICKLREALLDGQMRRPIRSALAGVLLGALHGPLSKGQPSYFSNQCPRTYAPKPRYAVKFWKRHHLKAPQIDVISVIKNRSERYYKDAPKFVPSRAFLGDSRYKRSFRALDDTLAKWVVTSPPYYGLRTYVPDQWLRNWFLGGPPAVDYSTAMQVRHSSQEDFIEDLRRVWRHSASVCRDGASLVVRFGSINDRNVGNPLEMIKASLQGTDWRILTAKPAGAASKGRRQATSFGTNSDPISEFDVWSRLG